MASEIIKRIAVRVAALTQPLSDRYDYGSHPFPSEEESEEGEEQTSRSVVTHPPTAHPRPEQTSRSIVTHPPTTHPRSQKYTI